MSDPTPLLGVSACLFRADSVLLVERARPPFQGLLSLPGGRVRFGERLEEAVHREVREEAGLQLPRFCFVCLHEAVTAEAHAVIVVYRAARALAEADIATAGDDAAAVGFHKIDALEGLERQGRLTGGLVGVVKSAWRAHMMGL